MSSEPRLFIDPSLPKHNINCWGDHPTDSKQFLHLGASKCVIVWYQQSKSRMWWRFSCVKGHWAWMIVCEKRFCAIHPNFLNYCQALKNGRKDISHGKQKCFSQRIFKMEWKMRNCDFALAGTKKLPTTLQTLSIQLKQRKYFLDAVRLLMENLRKMFFLVIAIWKKCSREILISPKANTSQQ